MRKNNSISPEDQALFRQSMQGVKPLGQASPGLKYPDKTFTPTKPLEIKPYDLSSYYADPVEAESVLSFFRHGLSKKQQQDLKSGNIRCEARLDLHGLRPDQAQEQLSRFIQIQSHHQHRHLLIIHGKGGRYHEPPVIKNLVNHWLPQIPEVLGFQSAHPKHGGVGALYVILRHHPQSGS